MSELGPKSHSKSTACGTRLALVHATRLAMDPIVSACQSLWPEVEHVSVLDESLAIDRGKHAHLTDELSDRIVALCRHAERLDSHGVLFTCSAFGEAIEKAAASAAIPVQKPNAAMFEKALSFGERVTMIYTFSPSVAGMEQEFRVEAARLQSPATMSCVLAEGAREALEQGDKDEHNSIIARKVSEVRETDVVLLAHFSMATAAKSAADVTRIPVLDSPSTAIEKMRSLMESR